MTWRGQEKETVSEKIYLLFTDPSFLACLGMAALGIAVIKYFSEWPTR